jgi:hypothetical protein
MPSRGVKPNPGPANLSPHQMQLAIPKLERRIAELTSIDVSTIRERREPRFGGLVQNNNAELRIAAKAPQPALSSGRTAPKVRRPPGYEPSG